MFGWAIIIAAMTAPWVDEAGPGQVSLYGDWAVGCDNGWACEAQALEPEGEAGSAPLSLFVQRLGGPNQPYRVGFRNYEDDQPDRIGLIVDGRHMGWAESGGGEEFHFDPARTQAIVSALARGDAARLEGPNGEWLGDASLAGSYAALLFIEDRQHRTGTVTAGVAVGEAPASNVPEPPAVPRVRSMPIAARNGETATPLSMEEAEALHEARECDGFGERRTRNDAFILSDAADLILISCSDGAYNFSDIAYVRRDGQVAPARFDHVFAWGDDMEVPLLVNVNWDEDSGVLSTYAKGRGIGDCGTAERFVWDGEMFRLIERREMNQCRGSPYWIPVWRANVEAVEP